MLQLGKLLPDARQRLSGCLLSSSNDLVSVGETCQCCHSLRDGWPDEDIGMPLRLPAAMDRCPHYF